MNVKNNPLVTVIVISYNSADFIKDTLLSIANQDYSNLELIISDDGSLDETNTISEQWLLENSKRFTDTHLLTVANNTGVSANFKRGVEASNGVWLKIIAADDMLMPNCISTFVTAAINSPSNFCYISQMLQLKEGIVSEYELWKKYIHEFDFLTIEGKEKYYTVNSLFLHSPSIFLKRELFLNFNLIDEKYLLLEDQPLFFGLLRNGVDIKLLSDETVIYRRHNTNLTTTNSTGFLKNLDMAFWEFKAPFLKSTILGRLYIWSYRHYYRLSLIQNKKPTAIKNCFIKFFGIVMYLCTINTTKSIVKKYNIS